MAHERKKTIPDNQQVILAAIGKKICDLRTGTGLSIERFCVKHDIPRISYSNLEAGKNFQMTTLLKIIESHPDVKSLGDFFSDI
jgi:transcriptional regulator with XRE-family HTH domain